MPLRSDPVVSIRLKPDVLQVVDTRAAGAGLSRAAWLTALVHAAVFDIIRISEREGTAPAGLADSTPLPTPESRGQVDAVAPARVVSPAPADISFGKPPALVTELAPEDKAQLTRARAKKATASRFINPKDCSHPLNRRIGNYCPVCDSTVK